MSGKIDHTASKKQITTVKKVGDFEPSQPIKNISLTSEFKVPVKIKVPQESRRIAKKKSFARREQNELNESF